MIVAKFVGFLEEHRFSQLFESPRAGRRDRGAETNKIWYQSCKSRLVAYHNLLTHGSPNCRIIDRKRERFPSCEDKFTMLGWVEVGDTCQEERWLSWNPRGGRKGTWREAAPCGQPFMHLFGNLKPLFVMPSCWGSVPTSSTIMERSFIGFGKGKNDFIKSQGPYPFEGNHIVGRQPFLIQIRSPQIWKVLVAQSFFAEESARR